MKRAFICNFAEMRYFISVNINVAQKYPANFLFSVLLIIPSIHNQRLGPGHI